MLVRGLEVIGLFCFFSLIMLSFHQIFSGNLLQAFLWNGLALPCAYYLADLMTGLIHWVCDSFGSETTPIWGPMLVGPFRRHHRDPFAITRISLAENLGASAIAGGIILFFIRPDHHSYGFLWHLWLWFLLFSFLSNLFHRWSHWPGAEKPKWLLFLQRYHLVLPSEAHRVHHRPPFRKNYCILSGWANGLTNRIPWARVEAFLLRLGIPTNFD
jgi:hypothetical protein